MKAKDIPEWVSLYVELRRGKLYWKQRQSGVSNGATKPGTLVKGSKTKNGYIRTNVSHEGKSIAVMVHRLMWYLKHGNPPKDMFVDHKNQLRDDNRFKNLRLLTTQQNCQNSRVRKTSKSGILGVGKHGRKWRASITVNYEKISSPSFETQEEACDWRRKMERKYFKHKRMKTS